MYIGSRHLGPEDPPLVIAEIGINHEGDIGKARELVDAAADVGCECVKFQCHVVEDEMSPQARSVVPGNAEESIWEIMERCALSEAEDAELKQRTESRGMLYLSTPFSRAAADRLERLGVCAYKIGSGECNNLPLLRHIAQFGKPMVMSTGMNNLESVRTSVEIVEAAGVDLALMHVTSIYPTPYDKVRLGAMVELREVFPSCPVGLSDHTVDNFACLGAVALGASLLERHFTLSRDWCGPDVPISMTPDDLAQLMAGSLAIWQARGGSKSVLAEEQPTIDFAYACLVTTAPIRVGEVFSESNCWVKRPGTGEILARDYDSVLGRPATRDLPADHQVRWGEVGSAT